MLNDLVAEGHVLVPRMHEVCVDLVGDHHQVARQYHLGQGLQLGALEHPARRVLRVAEQQDARLGVERRLEPRQVQLPALGALAQRVLDEPSPAVPHSAQERRVDRRLHHHALPGSGELVQRHIDALHDVGQDLDAARVDLPAETRLHVLRAHHRQLGRARVERIAQVVVVERVLHDGAYGRRQREVHLRDPGGQHVRRVELPLLAPATAQQVEVEVVEIAEGPAHRIRSLLDSRERRQTRRGAA